ncbi:MAG: hypothetical protein R3247_06735 [Rhodothermales bacterium]|nr:hypothetical protein [Rhodothermales bacterium]
MFDPTSRYYRIPTATYERDDGTAITYVRRRFLPQGERLPTLAEVSFADGDRLDLIAARTLGNAEHFWRICDAENAMNPFDLEDEPGRTLRVPIPQANV